MAWVKYGVAGAAPQGQACNITKPQAALRLNVISHFRPSAYFAAMTRYLLALLLLPLPVAAQPVTQADVLQAELRSGWRAADGSHVAALHLQLAPEWKTYWRAPGDAGIPPEFDWAGSENLGQITVHWPRPDVFDFQGMQTIGYKQDVVLPLTVTPLDPSRPVFLRTSVSMGVCKDICMPASLTLSADLADQGAPDALISAALADQPKVGLAAGLTAISCDLTPLKDGTRVTARLMLPAEIGAETVVMEPDAPVWVSDSMVSREGAVLTAIADMVPSPGTDFTLDPASLRLTVLAGDQAMEVTGCPLRQASR